ncbi:5'-methylthioadenosine/adenosylhomocysteine nucleosidase [Liquorilactobacillus satsumensis]|uniref:adenosylhomocysteine nucleosidase n=1 Tax=Liquorilactobacillus satsumensis DSM 16230 = JCM 12392 TaxID=1423801 RepID=A0A0R1VDF2_9LACO|nr:5'-methylthioadenosine/adenosylhomocysteine nucleosidase [Liquorilactobacillus satsumensis]KRL99931.1 5-methylthioadenosine nucleosidase S-adenosylhomocysteine nucleosidase [Liquorilactobacillus satsumensis DSM 16230 = JCM 12392]MCP9311789.1 5'-methylthioadenosine/adenosylhomocysteine nucleosidase [Liquorilactobacillus satsumensis]MCP9328411.1 5'-methylthioadenosine/adenosylhomocysteine nucleosidase [Liquorilactobacillus satsumensis]MCP9358922.1 5'-methylthioadenosine/adenosylhomocysteine nu
MKYGILCAMDEELKELRAQLSAEKAVTLGGINFYEGCLGQQKVVLVRSGIGKVQAGMTTALLIVTFGATAVINSGSAGGIGTGLHVGDVVLSTAAAYYDVDTTAFGYLPGQLPQQPQRFMADEKLVAQIAQAAQKNGLHTKTGLIVTGDQFVASSEKIAKIKQTYPAALCCEMEGAAVAQAAFQFKVPFVIVRAMSDVGDEEAGQSFDEFIIEAGRRSAQMILNVLNV